MRQKLFIASGLALLLLALALAVTFEKQEVAVTEAGEPAATVSDSPAPDTESGPAPRPGMTATLDAAGEKYVQPDPEQMQRMTVDAQLTSDEGLEVEPGPDGEGYIVDLKGRFRTAVVATVDDEGKITTDCVQESPEETPPERDNQ